MITRNINGKKGYMYPAEYFRESIYNIQNTDKDENETDLYFLKDFSYAENEIDEKIWR